MLPLLLVKLLVILATLSLRIIELADLLTICSLRARPIIPGYGKTSRVQTSARRLSIRIRSARGGAKTCMRLVPRSDWDLLIEADEDVSLNAFVLLMITWQRPGPSVVVARCIEILLATVPAGL